ncbi:MAG: hypothetical protein ACRBCK_02410 [Alphaproteobacteria bacterium]
MVEDNNIQEDGLTKIWLADADANVTQECERGVTTQCIMAEVRGTRLHEDAVIDAPSNGAEGDVGIYRVMLDENTL